MPCSGALAELMLADILSLDEMICLITAQSSFSNPRIIAPTRSDDDDDDDAGGFFCFGYLTQSFHNGINYKN